MWLRFLIEKVTLLYLLYKMRNLDWENGDDLEKRIEELKKSIESQESSVEEMKQDFYDDASKLKEESRVLLDEIGIIEEEIASSERKTRSSISKIEELIGNISDVEEIQNTIIMKELVDLGSFYLESSYNPLLFSEKIRKAKEFGFEGMEALLCKKIEELNSTHTSQIARNIESFIQGFSVSSHSSLISMFTSLEDPSSKRAKEFVRLLDDISKEPVFAGVLSEIVSNIFCTRMQFHTNNSSIKTDKTAINFLIGILQNSLQTILILFNYTREKNFEFYVQFMQLLIPRLVNCVFELISREIFDNIVSFRYLFAESSSLDDWFSRLDDGIPLHFTDFLFNKFGKKWIKAENTHIRDSLKRNVSSPSAFIEIEPKIPEIGLNLCILLSELSNSIPPSISKEFHEKFYTRCVIKSERRIVSTLLEIVHNTEDITKKALMINTLNMLSVQIRELYEISDDMYQELVYDTEKLKADVSQLCISLSKPVFAQFVKSSAEYISIDRFRFKGGSPTQSLLFALDSITKTFVQIQSSLQENLFSVHFLHHLESSIDMFLFTKLLTRVEFKDTHSIDQFSTDLDSLIEFFGGSDLRKLRSARIVLSMKEEKYLNCELSDEEIALLLQKKSHVK